MDTDQHDRDAAPARQRVLLVVAWLLVVVLLGYGVIETLSTAVNIFTG